MITDEQIAKLAAKHADDRYTEDGEVAVLSCSPESMYEFARELIALTAAPEVKGEPVYQYERYCGSMRSNWIDCDKSSYEAFAKSPDDYRTRILYTHPLAEDLVKRIRALKVSNTLDFCDYRHNEVIDRIIALIEGAR